MNNKLLKALAFGFGLFILYLIYLADRGILPLPLYQLTHNTPGGDKAGHFILYGILAFLLALAFPRRIFLGWASCARVTLILAALVAFEEFTQSFFPFRTADWVDLAFSMFGILAGDFLAGRLRKG